MSPSLGVLRGLGARSSSHRHRPAAPHNPPVNARVRNIIWIGILALGVFGVVWFRKSSRAPESRPERFTVADRLAQIGPGARARWAAGFQDAGVAYPPAQVVLAAFKHERRLDVLAADPGGPLLFIRSYPILAASGDLGPKLREGDRQVPEGIYRITELNPNSRFHVSLRVGYPNEFDLARAAIDGRAEPGTDIMIHGSNFSIGCLAMGDESAEDLFALAADTGLEAIDLLIAPHDPRSPQPAPDFHPPDWMQPIYRELETRIRPLPLPGP